MARSLSQFIAEQEMPSNHDTNDGSLERTYVETMIAFSTAQCYLEQAALIDFAAENGIERVTVVQESGDTGTETKDNIFKKAGRAIGDAWGWFIRMIKRIWDTISGKFRKKKVDKTVDEMSEIFTQFKEKYPEITDTTSSGDFYQFLKNKFPKAWVKVSAEDMLVLNKYGGLVDAITVTNAYIDELCEKAKDPQAGLAFDKKEIETRIADERKKWKSSSSYFSFTTDEATGKKTTHEIKGGKQPMGEIIDDLEKIKGLEKGAGELCIEGKRKLATFEKLINEGNAATQKAISDKSVAPSAEEATRRFELQTRGTQIIKDNESSLKAMKDWVNSLTKSQAEVTAAYDKVSAALAETLGRALDKALAQDKEEDFGLEQAAYYV